MKLPFEVVNMNLVIMNDELLTRLAVRNKNAAVALYAFASIEYIKRSGWSMEDFIEKSIACSKTGIIPREVNVVLQQLS